jgi:hypothetical protein
MASLVAKSRWYEAVALLPAFLMEQQQEDVINQTAQAYRRAKRADHGRTADCSGGNRAAETVHQLMKLCLSAGRPEVADAIYEHAVCLAGDHLGAIDATPAPAVALQALQAMGRQWRRSVRTLRTLRAVNGSAAVCWRRCGDSSSIEALVGGQQLRIAPQSAIEVFMNETRDKLEVLRQYEQWDLLRRLALHRLLRLCNSVRLRCAADPWDLVLLGNEVLDSTAAIARSADSPSLKRRSLAEARSQLTAAATHRVQLASAELPSDPSASDPLNYISLNCHNFDELLVGHLQRVCANPLQFLRALAERGGDIAESGTLSDLRPSERTSPTDSFAAAVARTQLRERRSLLFPDSAFIQRYFDRLVSLSQHREVCITYSVLAQLVQTVEAGGVHRYGAVKKLHTLLQSLSLPLARRECGRERDGVTIFGLAHELYACHTDSHCHGGFSAGVDVVPVPLLASGPAGRICLVAKTAMQCSLDGGASLQQSSMDAFLADIGFGDPQVERIEVAIATHDPTLKAFASALGIPVVW